MDKVTPFDRKILKLIHTQILDSYIKDYEQHGDEFDLDILIEDVDELSKIYNFLNDTMELGPSASQAFIDLLISNFNPKGDYEDLENAIYTPKEQATYEKIYTEHSGVTPYLIEGLDEGGTVYSMPVVWDGYKDTHFMIGDTIQMERAVRDYYEDAWINEEEVISAIGEDAFIDYLKVSPSDARMIAGEEARHMIEDMSDRDLLDRLEDMNSPLRNEYDSVENEINDIEEWGAVGAHSVKELENLKDNIIDRAREMLREEHYDYTYERITENLKDWLWEFGYINQQLNKGYFNFGDHLRKKEQRGGMWGAGSKMVDFNKFPSWLNFDMEEFIDNEVEDAMQGESFEMLSDSGEYAQSITYDGDTYYIVDIDY